MPNYRYDPHYRPSLADRLRDSGVIPPPLFRRVPSDVPGEKPYREWDWSMVRGYIHLLLATVAVVFMKIDMVLVAWGIILVSSMTLSAWEKRDARRDVEDTDADTDTTGRE